MKKNKIKLKEQKELPEEVSPRRQPLDKFIDEDTQVNDAYVAQPTDWDVRDEMTQLDGFRDYIQESRGNGLTYGDY